MQRLTCLSGCLFIVWDSKVCWQMGLERKSRVKSAFITSGGLYDVTVEHFGLKKAGMSFPEASKYL